MQSDNDKTDKIKKALVPRPFSLLTGIFFLALVVLCLLSLRQYLQLQEIKRVYDQKSSVQLDITNQLVNHLLDVQRRINTRIEEEINQQLQNTEQVVFNHQRLEELRQAQEELSRQVSRFSEQTGSSTDYMLSQELTDLLGKLSSEVERSGNQLAELIRQNRRDEEIVAQLSGGVCLIQGEYMFVDPKSQRPLRYIDELDRDDPTCAGQLGSNAVEIYPEKTNEPLLPVSVEGKGQLWRIQYTATGFLVDKLGYILTNKHVTEPWKVTREYKHVLEAGYEGRLCMFRAFFPGKDEPFELQVATTSAQEDIALLKCELQGNKIPVLPCESQPSSLRAGQTVIVLGYPTGFDALLARLGQEELDDIVAGGASFEQMGLSLARLGLVEPTGTRGMCGRVNQERIVYDAQTAIGGSGGPVLGPQGKVVGINTALLRKFSGTSFGIPIQQGMELVEQMRSERGKNGPIQTAGKLSGL